MMKEDAIISGPQRSNQGCKTKIKFISTSMKQPRVASSLSKALSAIPGLNSTTQWLVAYDQRQELFHFSGSSRGRLF
jgi:hypothetical protein